MPDDETVTNEGAGRSRGDDATPPGAGHTLDTRWQTRRQKESARRRRLIAERDERLKKEAQVLAVAATGASLSEIAAQVRLSKSQVHRIYQEAMDRVETEHIVEYKRGAMHSLGTLKQAAWRIAYASEEKVPARVRISAMREARQIQDQMNRIAGAYPPAQIDVQGEINVRREVSVREATSIVARIQAGRVLAGDAPIPANWSPSTNGHAPELPAAHENGSAA